MAEASSNVRLVRCPKCGNLLPELHDFSVYQCGGCGTVLRAKNKGILDDGLSELSDGEKIRAVPDRGDVAMTVDTVSDFDEERSEFQQGRPTEGRSHNGRMVSHRRVISGSNDKEVLDDFDKDREGEPSLIKSRLDTRFRRDNYYDDNECSTSKGKRDHSIGVGNYWGKINTVESVGLGVSNGLKKVRPLMDSLGSGPPMDSRYMDRSYANGPNEGPLENDMGSYYGSVNHRRYNGGLDGVAGVPDLESNRAELLRKINELKDQLSRTCDVSEKPKDRVPVDGRIASTSIDPSSRYDVHNQGYYGPSKNIQERPYTYGHQGNVPYNGARGSMMPDSYPSNNFSHEFLGYGLEYCQQMLRKPPRQMQYQHFTPTYPEHYPGHHADNFIPHPHEALYHQSSCSCSHCLNRNYHVPPVIQPSGFCTRRSRNGPANPILQHMNSVGYHEGRRLTRSHSDLESENGGLGNQRYPRRVVVAHRVGRVYQPIAGGAPFVTCCGCFELLKLPKKLMITGKSKKKMRCGSCSSIILFQLGSKESGASVPTVVKQLSANENLENANGGFTNDEMSPWSDDFDNSNYHFTDTKLESPSRSQKSNSTEPEKGHNGHFSSSSLSEDELSPESPTEMPLEDDPLPLLDSSQNDHAYSVSPKDVVEKYRKEEDMKENRSTSRQNSIKDLSMAVEMETNGFVHSAVSVESIQSSKEENLSKSYKGGDSFMGFIKRSLGELSRSHQSSENVRANVFVNGRPIPDRIVKKAEKLAGPIQPGDYWYDYRAGFWGVMGHPCLGVILPKIEEFNYPIPKDCAAGNTGIYVNGRELHQKDLDLLESRGLPITKNKSYFIEISGSVIDEHTGEELDGLGKLAPTVEKVKHGFGMKVPKAIADQYV
ncbi:protein ENHANCED DISEASE RESISTANCE 4-like [Lycium barbarum]|uniref:protein ENHANCED DISEASE RESISTANCE 4-like n=1 Tax=Lycium barbarum TaxID=112863 RepID=UPI00293F56D4|nr:protein ENHANCED DISEASE RESISTANCE 4-like [Lycium barbarum]